MQPKPIVAALLAAIALIAAAYAVWQVLLDGQCDPEFTAAECARLG